MSFTGNSNYTALAIYTVEQTIKRDWTEIWTSGYPVLKVMEMDGTNFNKGFSVSGLKMLVPIAGDDMTTPAAAVPDADQNTSDTLNNTAGFGQAEFEFARYRATYTIQEAETMLAANGARGNLLEGKKKQFISSFKNAISNHLADSTAATNRRIMGMGQPLSTSNTVGGISQTTDTQWASNVTTGYGPYAPNCIDAILDAIRAKDRFEPDLIMAAFGNGSTTNVYAKIRDQIAPSERFENNNSFTVKYGIKAMIYQGIPVVMDNRITGGTLRVFSTKSWFLYVPRKPKMVPTHYKDGTDTALQTGAMWCASGICDPGSNGIVSGIE